MPFYYCVGLFALGFRVLGTIRTGNELSEKSCKTECGMFGRINVVLSMIGMEKLAISISADSIYAIPAEVLASGEEKTIAKKLAQVLDMDEEALLERITKASSFEWIKRQVDPEKSAAIRDMDLPGIDMTEESRRYYPKGTLASHVLKSLVLIPVWRIDYYYNELVGGTPGRIVIEHDAANRPIPEATHKYIAPVDGANLILTIDETIQYITERELDKVFKERQAKAAAAIVMDPSTGEILALANRPTFDPNHYGIIRC